MLNPDTISIPLSNLSFLSPDSRCYSFDHRANGYSRGEGFGVVLIKLLSEALRDGNTIPSSGRVQKSGVSPKSSPPRAIEKQRVYAEKATQLDQIINAMPRNKVFNNLNHVRLDSKPSKTPKGSPPKP